MSETKTRTQEFDSQSVMIERAVPDDAKEIVRIKRDAWLEAYPDTERGITLEDIDKKLPEESLPEAINNWRQGIAAETESANRVTFVARAEGKVVGFVAPAIESGQRRIAAMYVSPDAQGIGIGGKLLDKALSWHGREEEIYLDVVSYNADAIGFYEHYGFHKTGKESPESYDEEQGIKLLPETEMVYNPNGTGINMPDEQK